MKTIKVDSLGFEILNKISMDENKKSLEEINKEEIINDNDSIIFYNIDNDKYFIIKENDYKK
jgi:hypothetical protein